VPYRSATPGFSAPGRTVSRERITGLIPGRRFTYEIAGGQFSRSYLGVAELAAAPPGGTDITWPASFEPKLLLTGPLWAGTWPASGSGWPTAGLVSALRPLA
jgi:hypothetical protein